MVRGPLLALGLVLCPGRGAVVSPVLAPPAASAAFPSGGRSFPGGDQWSSRRRATPGVNGTNGTNGTAVVGDGASEATAAPTPTPTPDGLGDFAHANDGNDGDDRDAEPPQPFWKTKNSYAYIGLVLLMVALFLFVIAMGIGCRRPLRRNYRNCAKRWGPLPCCPDVRERVRFPATPPDLDMKSLKSDAVKRPMRPSAAAASYFTPDTPPPPPLAPDAGDESDDSAPLRGENTKVTPHIATHII